MGDYKETEKTGIPPHQSRVVAEKMDLDDKLGKLNAFFGTDVFAELPYLERERLHEQAGYMTSYSTVLGERIAAF